MGAVAEPGDHREELGVVDAAITVDVGLLQLKQLPVGLGCNFSNRVSTNQSGGYDLLGYSFFTFFSSFSIFRVIFIRQSSLDNINQ